MNLVVDIGNTQAKAAVFKNDTRLDQVTVPLTNLLAIRTFFLAHPDITKGIISGTGAAEPGEVQKILSGIPVVLFSPQTPVPLINRYKSPETLGTDRLAAAVAAVSLFPGREVLVVDAGTCITYDFADKEGAYHGGSISPGLTMRFKALNTFTAKLPLISPDRGFTKLTGETTSESILSGVQEGAVAEMEGMIMRYREQYPDLQVLLCGGDTDFFAVRLKNSIFVEPDLVLTGLNRILTHQHV